MKDNKNPKFNETKTFNETRQSEKILDEGEAVLPVVEEEISVGKREVERGGVRVTTSVTQTPVEEQVTLRDETVHIDRQPVNRALTDADRIAMQSGVIEVTETDEEAVVGKQARIVEEVHIGKKVTERTETIKDSVRRTDVEVVQLEAAHSTSADMSGYTTMETDFKNNYQTNYAKSGYTYEQYAPVYQYGYSLNTDQRFSNVKDWNKIESNVKQDWEAKNPGTWTQFKDSIHYAWDKARGAAR